MKGESIGTRVNTEMARLLEQASAERGLTMADFIRTVLAETLASRSEYPVETLALAPRQFDHTVNPRPGRRMTADEIAAHERQFASAPAPSPEQDPEAFLDKLGL